MRQPGVTLTVQQRRELRPVLAYQAMLLRAWGLSCKEIGAALGCSRTQAGELISDPLLVKRRKRMQKYGGTCEVCGARTSPRRGSGSLPPHERCARHALLVNGRMMADLEPAPEPYSGPTVARGLLDVDLQERAEAAWLLCRDAKTEEERLDLLAAVVWPSRARYRVAA